MLIFAYIQIIFIYYENLVIHSFNNIDCGFLFYLGELILMVQTKTAKILSIVISAFLFIPVSEVVQKNIDKILLREF